VAVSRQSETIFLPKTQSIIAQSPCTVVPAADVENLNMTAKEKIPTTYRVFAEDGTFADHETLMAKKPIYDELCTIVEPHLGGARLMHVRVLCPMLGKWTDMFIDDMGALKRLCRNDAATRIYRNGFLSKRSNDDPECLPYIAGPAVVFLRPVWEAEANPDHVRSEGSDTADTHQVGAKGRARRR
jgi:hypothetical protein